MPSLFRKAPQRRQNPQLVNSSSHTGSQPQASLSIQGSAYLSRGTKVKGKLAFGGSVKVDGEVDGEITAEDRLHIGVTAIVTARVKGATVVVAGKVTGDITGSKQIEIHSTAQVVGNLVAPVLIIQQGAQFVGRCSMPGALREGEKAVLFPSRVLKN